ncbi:MAG: hypothetical protein EPN33_09600 [Acidobacteria bacterium]|nr:MAG: hypothetical protein EPN33_09600 [Acidobacteriota bacterium]
MDGSSEGARPAPVSARQRQELDALAALHSPYLSLGADALEGETLAARLARGPLDQPLEVAIEIATGLEGPHALGILHRGLAAGKVWLLPDGHIKLLGFGLVEGDEFDPRADQPAFGIVLEALASGAQARALRRIARRCQAKHSSRRFQSTTALREALERLRPIPGTGRRGASWRIIAFAVIALLIGGVTWRKLASLSSGPLPVPDLSFSQATFTANIAAAAISPDGLYLATIHRDPEGESLYWRSVTGGRERQLVSDGANCCSAPAISRDDDWVYFLAKGELHAVSVAAGGMERAIAPARSSAGFAPGGQQMAFIDASGHLEIAQPDGTQPRELSSTAYAPVTPAWSPDGQSIAAVRGNALEVISVSDGQLSSLAEGKFWKLSGLVWLPNGRGLIVTGATSPHAATQLWQVPWPNGAVAQITDDRQGYSSVSASRDGTLAVLHSTPEASLWAQAKVNGPFTELPGGGLTRDGVAGLAWLNTNWLLTTHVFHHDHQLWAMSVDGAHARPIALPGVLGEPIDPLVAPDGHIVFLARTGDEVRVWRANADGSAAVPLSAPSTSWTGLALIGGGGAVIAKGPVSHAATCVRDHNLWTLPRRGSAPHPLTHFRDGHIFAYAFARDGRLALSRGRDNTNVFLATGIAAKK